MRRKVKSYVCSFCGRDKSEALLLIAGIEGHICEVCAELAVEIVNEEIYKGKQIESQEQKIMAQNFSENGGIHVNPLFNNNFTPKNKHIFYLGPLKKPFYEIYQSHISNVAKKIGFSINRAYEIFGTQLMLANVWESINIASLIIADITDKDPRVMYEIGLAHAIGKPIVIITQEIEDTFFDLGHNEYINYNNNKEGFLKLEFELEQAIKLFEPRD